MCCSAAILELHASDTGHSIQIECQPDVLFMEVTTTNLNVFSLARLRKHSSPVTPHLTIHEAKTNDRRHLVKIFSVVNTLLLLQLKLILTVKL